MNKEEANWRPRDSFLSQFAVVLCGWNALEIILRVTFGPEAWAEACEPRDRGDSWLEEPPNEFGL